MKLSFGLELDGTGWERALDVLAKHPHLVIALLGALAVMLCLAIVGAYTFIAYAGASTARATAVSTLSSTPTADKEKAHRSGACDSAADDYGCEPPRLSWRPVGVSQIDSMVAHQPLHRAARHRKILAAQLLPETLSAPYTRMLPFHTRSISGSSAASRRRLGGHRAESRRRAASRLYADGATCKALQIGSTPTRSRCWSMKGFMTSSGGRAPPGRKTRWPVP